ncbi:MAG: L,D-transpeptidase family protein [Kiritimatiellales bacterium]|jgi:lipoprotein-anchoring transpeptidase ErfK/SrfK
MADIFVKPYDEQHKPHGRFVKTGLIVLAVTAIVIGLCLWMDNRSAKAAEPKPAAQEKPVVQEKPAAQPVKTPVPAPVPAPAPAAPAAPAVSDVDYKAQQLFTHAQTLAAAGKLLEARDLLGEAAATATEENLKNNALRVQGRINVQLFLSPVPTPEKKTYVIQPGDSLDKIARQNKTTVELIRKMNKMENNNIYPGGRLMMPAAPFVLQVSKSAKTVDVTMNGKILKRYIAGLGMNGKTPLGTFHTVVHQTNPDWTPPGGGIIKFGDPRNLLGTRWMSIQDPTRPDIKGFGIHGTPARDSIGAETSNGCIRMLNEDVEELYLLIPRGTEVIISE